MKTLSPGAVPAAVTLSLGALIAVGPFSLDTYLPAFPTIAVDLQATPQQIQLSLTACLIGLALGQLLVGPWGDRIGRRTPLLIGSAGFLVASLACAISPSIEFFIIARFMQGFAGAAGQVMARAIVRDLAVGREAVALYSRLAVVSGLAPVIAPVLGAVGLAFVSWRGIFVGLAVLGGLLILLVATQLPESHHPASRTVGGLSATMRAFASVARDRAFVGYAVLNGFTAVILFSYISGSSFVFQTGYGASSTVFAVAFAVNGLGIAVLGRFNAALVATQGPSRILRIGVVIQAVGALLLLAFVMSGIDVGAFTVGTFAVLLFLTIAPLGLVLPNVMAICMGQSGGHSGTASALLGVMTFLFGALATVIGGLGDPSTVMVTAIGCASAVCVVSVFVLKHRVKILED